MKDRLTTLEDQTSTSASTPSGSYKASTGDLAYPLELPEGAGTAASPSKADFTLRVESVTSDSRQSVRFHIDVAEQQERRTLAKLNSRLQRIKQQ